MPCFVCEMERDSAVTETPLAGDPAEAILCAVSICFEAEIPLCYGHLGWADGFISPTDDHCYWVDGLVTP